MSHSDIFRAKLNRKLVNVLDTKIHHRNVTSIGPICFAVFWGLSFTRRMHINFGVTYFENKDYQSWFIVATLVPEVQGKS